MSARKRSAPVDDLARVAAALEAGPPTRLDLAGRGRLYIERPLPFIAVYVGRRAAPAARAVTMANASYLLAANLAEAAAIIRLVGEKMREQFGAFLVLDFGELSADRLAQDAPYLAPFQISVSVSAESADAALTAFVSGLRAFQPR
jgi:hypothetical protein